jgi:hypothetical protein
MAVGAESGSPVPPPSVEEVLQAIEKSHASIEQFSSPLTLRREYALEGDSETRIGELAVIGRGANREVVVIFDRVIDASGHGTDRPRYHLYEKGWWTEVDTGRKRILARQITAPGSTRDPFQLGEGPLPIPLGQDPKRVLARFDVSFGAEPTHPLFATIKNALVLHLVPKPGTPAAEDLAAIELLYAEESHLPVGVLLESLNGDKTIAWLRKPRVGTETEPISTRAQEIRATLERAATTPGWSIERKPLATENVEKQ